jgi:hypothetical protein
MENKGKSLRRWGGRFVAFRIDCERVPQLPAWAVRWVWEDPRRIPYLLLWKHPRDGVIKDAVRIARPIPRTNLPEADSVEIKRADGSTVPIYLAWRRQPHGGRCLLLRCWQCQRPSRALYGWRVGNDGRYYRAELADWQCRRCAGLSYASEGDALLYHRSSVVSRIFRLPYAAVSSSRPEVWLPYVFSSPEDAAQAGFI